MSVLLKLHVAHISLGHTILGKKSPMEALHVRRVAALTSSFLSLYAVFAPSKSYLDFCVANAMCYKHGVKTGKIKREKKGMEARLHQASKRPSHLCCML